MTRKQAEILINFIDILEKRGYANPDVDYKTAALWVDLGYPALDIQSGENKVMVYYRGNSMDIYDMAALIRLEKEGIV